MGRRKQQSEDTYGQAAGALGALVLAFGGLAAIKDKLGLSWPTTVALTAGALVALGYLAWRIRVAGARLWARQPSEQGVTVALAQEAPDKTATDTEAASGAEEEPADRPQPQLTTVLRTAGVIAKDEIIRDDEATSTPLDVGGHIYDFLLPKEHIYDEVERKLPKIAGGFGVTRLHTKPERSRVSERQVRLLVLDQEPFTRPFTPPTRQEIAAFAGVPLGHDVTGKIVGVPTLDKASMVVGGMSQTGKTTLINGMITCLLIAYGEFDLYLLDGKFCGLITFAPVCVRYESSDDPAVFESMVDELNARVVKRYEKMREAKRNRQPEPKFKPVIFIVDEAADFFADDGTPKGKEKAAGIAEKARKLAAKSLESGISVILLTQRPDRDAIPIHVRNQCQYRVCMYVESEGTAKVTLGDSYFTTAAPINPTHLNPHIKGQAVLFAGGTSTLIRGFHFEDEFMWKVVDEVSDRQRKALDEAPATPLKQAIRLMREAGADFMATRELAPKLGIHEEIDAERGKKLSALLGGVGASKCSRGRGYWLDDLVQAAMSDS